MSLIKKKVTKKLNNYDEITAFMKRVFPKEELMPMWLLHLITKKKNYDFSAYYDNDLFVGITFTINSKETLFIFYIAVNDKIQSKGYGSKLLDNLFEEYKDKPISLFIETMDEKNASNYEQRVKRLAFYEKNGFFHTGIKAGFKKPFVDILASNKDYNVSDAKKLLKLIPMRIFTDNIEE